MKTVRGRGCAVMRHGSHHLVVGKYISSTLLFQCGLVQNADEELRFNVIKCESVSFSFTFLEAEHAVFVEPESVLKRMNLTSKRFRSTEHSWSRVGNAACNWDTVKLHPRPVPVFLQQCSLCSEAQQSHVEGSSAQA